MPHWTQTAAGRKKMAEIGRNRRKKIQLIPEISQIPMAEFKLLAESKTGDNKSPQVWQLIETLEAEIQEKQTVLKYLKGLPRA